MRQALPGVQERHRHEHISLMISIQHVRCLIMCAAADACGDIPVVYMTGAHWHPRPGPVKRPSFMSRAPRSPGNG